MASDIAISVEGLSKSYLLGHKNLHDPNVTLRDQIVGGVRDLARKTRDMARGRAIVQGDSVEEFWALRDVSFDIPRGARVGILGRNGAGKSTLLKLLSRITEPTNGRIKINGRVASLLEVGTGFHPELSGRENIFLNGAILGMSRREIQTKFDEIVEFAEVERFLDTPVKRYSSGMYVRLAFSVAAHLEPEILIVDEVLAVGDAKFQQKCLGKLQDVGQDGRTVLFVSHNIPAIRQLCETAIFLQGGSLIDNCSVESAISQYMNQGTSSTGSRSWPGGIGEDVQLLGVQLIDAAGMVRSDFEIREQLRVQISVSVKQEVGDARIGFRLVSNNGSTVFSSEDLESLDGSTAATVGDHTLSATIPGGLLNEGTYFLTFAAHQPNVRWLFLEENALQLNIHQTDRLGGEIGSKRLGFVLANLQWTRSTGRTNI